MQFKGTLEQELDAFFRSYDGGRGVRICKEALMPAFCEFYRRKLRGVEEENLRLRTIIRVLEAELKGYRTELPSGWSRREVQA